MGSDNPVILVTGSAKRIGAEIVRQAHAHGYNVIIHYNTSYQQASQLAKQLNAIRANSAKIVQADLAVVNDQQQLQTFIKQIIDCFGRLDALVNNASRFYPTDINHSNHQQLSQQWQELFLTNAQAPFMLALELLPFLRQTKGNIINILDIHANGKPFKNYSIYNMAKSAGQMMVQSLALELAPDVRVNGIAPAVNIFPESNSDQSLDPKMQQAIEQSIPIQRIGTPSDIAGAVLYLLHAEYVTGQIIAIDGGRSLTLAGG